MSLAKSEIWTPPQPLYLTDGVRGFDGWFYIRTYHDDYHLLDEEMLFNVKDDPYEQRNLKEKHLEICNCGAKIILDRHDTMMKNSACEMDPI